LWAFAQVDHSDNLECGKNLVFVEFTAGMMIAVTCPFTTGRCEYQSAMSRRMWRCGGGSHFQRRWRPSGLPCPRRTSAFIRDLMIPSDVNFLSLRMWIDTVVVIEGWVDQAVVFSKESDQHEFNPFFIKLSKEKL